MPWQRIRFRSETGASKRLRQPGSYVDPEQKKAALALNEGRCRCRGCGACWADETYACGSREERDKRCRWCLIVKESR